MARVEFTMPDVGEGLADVEIIKWYVSVGDQIKENETIADVETDKAVVTMPAPATGTVVEFGGAEGDRVKVGGIYVIMETDDPQLDKPPDSMESDAESLPSTETGSRESQPKRTPDGTKVRVMASPFVRKLAKEMGVLVADVVGTGPNGRVTESDLRDYVALAAPSVQDSKNDPNLPKPEAAQPQNILAENVPVKGLRRRIAEGLTKTYQSIPHVSGFHEFDAQALMNARSDMLSQADDRGIKLTFLAYIIKACVLALRKHPYLNASYVEGDPPNILLMKECNIGVATATPSGLVVPVLHGADKLDLFGIADATDQLITDARDRKSTPQVMKNGTFTISNVGPAGGWFGTSIIRGSEAAILGVGQIQDKAVVRDGEIVVRPVLPISLTFDHRVVDGDEALAFVMTLRDHLEREPVQLASRMDPE